MEFKDLLTKHNLHDMQEALEGMFFVVDDCYLYLI